MAAIDWTQVPGEYTHLVASVRRPYLPEVLGVLTTAEPVRDGTGLRLMGRSTLIKPGDYGYTCEPSVRDWTVLTRPVPPRAGPPRS